MTITPLYAGILSLMFVYLSFRVIGMRRAAHIGLGDGGNPLLVRRLRVHGNFAEYVPLALVLMLLMELQEKPDWLIHGIGIALLCGRLIHTVGVGREPENYKIRTVGIALNFAALIAGAMSNLGLNGIAMLLAST
ncbi:MAG: glutathione metabolism protein [Alphaproteobacteria bacterium]|nr:glutathione metabolism protein [Alphaproteobacteria bacterium]